MKKRMGVILAIAAAVLVVCLLMWRFWPQPASRLMAADETSITGFSAGVMVLRNENGQATSEIYSIKSTDGERDDIEAILDILSASAYRQDFRNLLPWNAGHVDADKNYDGRTVMLAFTIGIPEEESIHIQFLSGSILTVSVSGEDKLRIYHPTNPNTIDALTEYLQTHGTKQ